MPWSALQEGRGQGFGDDPHFRWIVLWDLILEAEIAAAAKISAQTVEAVDLPCISSMTPGLILRVIYGQGRIAQDCLRIKGASNLHREFLF